MKVVAGILTQKSRLLLTRRPLNKNHGGLWEFPGGKVESGEGLIAALQRELQEELHTEIDPHRCLSLGCVNNKDLSIHFFLTALIGTYSPQEHDATAWLALEEVSRKDLCPLDQQAIHLFAPKIQQSLVTLNLTT